MPSRTEAIVRCVDQGGLVTLRGVQGLALARAVLEYAVRAAGYDVAFDPDSAADLVDYLAVTGASGLEGATVGAGLGAALGLLFERPTQGAVLGLGLGLLAGLAHGADRVERGWRVRAVREIDGAPTVTLGLLESGWR